LEKQRGQVLLPHFYSAKFERSKLTKLRHAEKTNVEYVRAADLEDFDITGQLNKCKERVR
jgi:hypothetical protein